MPKEDWEKGTAKEDGEQEKIVGTACESGRD
jgi:hypothetical protein